MYAHLSNFPPACKTVNIVSKADFHVFSCLSTGIPLPLSCMVTEPSSLREVVIVVQYPANASSTALSIIS